MISTVNITSKTKQNMIDDCVEGTGKQKIVEYDQN